MSVGNGSEDAAAGATTGTTATQTTGPVRHWPHGVPVVDGHVHVNRFDLMAPGPRSVIAHNPTFPLMERFMRDPDAFLAHLDAEGVWQAWLVNYCARQVMGYGWEVNPWVAGYVQADPRRLVAVGGYDPREDGGRDAGGAVRHGAAAVDALRELGIRALKVHPVHQHLRPDAHRDGTVAGGRLRAAYARAEELRLPVIVHTGTSVFPGADNALGDVAPIDAVCADFPDLPVILAHGGRPDRCAAALDLVARHPDAWLDLSSLPPKRIPAWFGDLGRAFPDGRGGTVTLAHRTLWGSDWPGPKVPGMGANAAAFVALGFSADAQGRVLHDNAVGLLAAVR